MTESLRQISVDRNIQIETRVLTPVPANVPQMKNRSEIPKAFGCRLRFHKSKDPKVKRKHHDAVFRNQNKAWEEQQRSDARPPTAFTGKPTDPEQNCLIPSGPENIRGMSAASLCQEGYTHLGPRADRQLPPTRRTSAARSHSSKQPEWRYGLHGQQISTVNHMLKTKLVRSPRTATTTTSTGQTSLRPERIGSNAGNRGSVTGH